MSEEVVKTVTCYGCPHAACFVKAHIVDGELVKVTPDPDKVYVQDCTRGFMDNDGRASIEYHYMKNRINYPLKRVGERGENRWEVISWDQALDEIAGKMKELMENHGPNCISVNTGTAHHSDNNWVPWRFHVAIGSVNHTGHEHICYGAQMISMEHTFGWVVNPYPAPGIFPKSMILIGNSYEAMPHAFQMMEGLWEAGQKLIVVDPRCTESARRADIWLQERPGSDIGLWLCWIRTIMKEGWYDSEFVENWSNAPFLVRTDTGKMLRGTEIDAKAGPESFVVWNAAKDAPAIWDAEARKYAEDGVQQALSGTHKIKLVDGAEVECKTAWDMLAEQVEEWTPEKAEEFTWVPKHKIMEACEMYAKNAPGFFLTAGHVYDAYAPGSSSVYRCRDLLRILTGSIDKTEMITGCYDIDKVVSIYEMENRPDEAFTAEEKAKQAGFDRFKALGFEGFDLKAKYAKRQWRVPSNAMWSCQAHPHLMWRDILDGKEDRLRCMIMSGSNPLLKYGNVRIVYEAMKKLDLTIALEFVMTPSAQMADYVLPMSDWFERPEIGPSTPCDIFNLLHASGAAMEPEYERRNDYDVFRGIAVRLGLEEHFPWKTLTEAYNYRMAGILKETGCKDIDEFGEKIGFDYPEPVVGQYKEKNGFATPTAKAELWSVMLEEMGYEPLPRYYEPAISPYSTPELAEDYPLILIGIDRHLPMYHTMFFEVPALRKMCPDPFMDIHPDTARRMDPPITDGDWVWVETRRGRIRQRARLTFGIHPSVVKTQHHWWFPEKPGEEPYLHGVWESNTNVITEDDPELCDPVFGSWPHTSLLCRVYKEAAGSHLEEDRTC